MVLNRELDVLKVCRQIWYIVRELVLALIDGGLGCLAYISSVVLLLMLMVLILWVFTLTGIVRLF